MSHNAIFNTIWLYAFLSQYHIVSVGDKIWLYTFLGQFHIVSVGGIIRRYAVWGQYHIVRVGISFGFILSNVSFISSVWRYHLALYFLMSFSYRQCGGYHLMLYSLRSVLYRQCGDILLRYTVWGQYHIVRVGISFGFILSNVFFIPSVCGISFGVILSEVSINSSEWRYHLALYFLRSVSYRQCGGYHLVLYSLRSV